MIDKDFFLEKWEHQDKKKHYRDETKLGEIIRIDREMTKVEASLKVDAVESLRKERRQQEDQTKSSTTETKTFEEPYRRKRMRYNTIESKVLLLFLEEVVEKHKTKEIRPRQSSLLNTSF